MSFDAASLTSPWQTALMAAALTAIDPAGSGGIVVRSGAGPVRDAWVTALRAFLDSAAPVRRLPLGITDDRLLGGLDLAATLKSGRPAFDRGLLAEADGGVIIIASAERLERGRVARITAAIDSGGLHCERDGFTLEAASRFAVVAFDEGHEGDTCISPALMDRTAFYLDLNGIRARDATDMPELVAAVSSARKTISQVTLDARWIDAVCHACAVLGIASVRAPLLALKVARASAAIAGRICVSDADVALAARLVLAPRATQLPAEPDAGQQMQEDDLQNGAPQTPPEPPPDASNADEIAGDVAGSIVIDAASAAIPPGLLEKLRTQTASRIKAETSGHSGAVHAARLRGRPAGVRTGRLGHGARLNVIETLRAAAPWQPLRRRERQHDSCRERRIDVRPCDFRITRFKERSETTTIFVVDASGSAALHRLSEAKGAVELLLADCYVRRDSVALIAFRGKCAELLLPPTRSLTRAKRSLIGLPGGGGTPLASAVDATFELAASLKRKGQTPAVVLLTDGRANIARDGRASREAAELDALTAAQRFRAEGITALLIDTYLHRQPKAERLAAAMGARYLPLPHANSAVISDAVRATHSAPRG